ncbi:Uncharacterised protein [Fusobacterium necrophorum subsp. necrophorum]|nr:Uncharacterised protein [Fusobacterium necrophorum subsp. necrophorum]
MWDYHIVKKGTYENRREGFGKNVICEILGNVGIVK